MKTENAHDHIGTCWTPSRCTARGAAKRLEELLAARDDKEALELLQTVKRAVGIEDV
jgi:hypothetical protein